MNNINNKLYWCSTPWKHEDWFVIANTKELARTFYADMDGFDEEDVKLKYICDILPDCESLKDAKIMEDSEYCAYYASNEQLEYLGFKILEENIPRVVSKDGKIYREGGGLQSILIERLEGVAGIYIIQVRGTEKYKIGKTTNLLSRLKTFKTGNSETIDLIFFIKTDNTNYVEKLLHKSFNVNRVGGEWFLLSEENLQEIKSIAEREEIYLMDVKWTIGY